jgi:hypothetical protein
MSAQFRRRAVFALGIPLALLAGFGAVVLSPLAMQSFADSDTLDWSVLSNIGQTYGAVAALLTALAIGGVVASLLVQGKEMRIAREQAARSLHQGLIHMAIEDPTLIPVFGIEWDHASVGHTRQQLYANLWITHFRSVFELGYITENELRLALADLFRGEVGRACWATSREAFIAGFTSRRHRKFGDIVEGEYARAVEAGPPSASADADGQNEETRIQGRSFAFGGILGASVVMVAWLAGRRLRK